MFRYFGAAKLLLSTAASLALPLAFAFGSGVGGESGSTAAGSPARSLREQSAPVDLVNQAPVANAGVNRSVTLPANQLVLSGTGTDADGTVVAYHWQQISGSSTANFSSFEVAGPTISALVVGSYVFTLVVTDDQGANSVASQATITVFPANRFPVAAAGSAQTIVLPIASVKLSGTGTDADGTVVAYRWQQASGPATARFSNTAVAAPTVTSLVAGTYVFSLVVTDDQGATSVTDQITVKVIPASQAPVANAGIAQTIVLPTASAQLAGTGRAAPGHALAAYRWRQLSGPAPARFSDSTLAAPTVSALVAGSYLFALTVTDEQGVISAPSQVSITVNPATVGAVAYRLNVGGGAVSTAAGAFAADAYFTPAPGTAYTSAANVSGTTAPALYRTERAGGRFSYALPVSNGTYSLVLHFAEFYWTQPGQRVFDVAAEGRKVLTRYDIVQKVGPFAATTETLQVTVTDGVLNLDFSALFSEGGRDQAKVNAIEILAPQMAKCPDAPLVSTPLAYCVGTQAGLLSSSVTLSEGATLRMYAGDTTKTQLPASFRPSTTVVATTDYYVTQVLNGCESARTRISVAIGSLTPPVLIPPAGIDQNNIAAWGDSFTDAGYGQYPRMLSQLTGLSVFNGGIGGETSAQTKIRMTKDAQKRNWPCIIWSGRNDSNNQPQVLASIAGMVASLGHSNYLIVPIFNGQNEGTGSYAYSQIGPLNSALAEIYGNRYLDVRSYIVSKYDSTKAQDVIDHAANTTPASLRSDFLHPNITGSNMIARYIYAHLDKLFGVDYRQGELSKPLSSSFKVVAGGTLCLYTAFTSSTALPDGYTPPTNQVGSIIYYASQIVNGCESSRTPVTINVVSSSASGTGSLTAMAMNNSVTANEFSGNAATDLAQKNLFIVYPNPAVDIATVEIMLKKKQEYKLEMYDVRGAKIKQISAGKASAETSYSFQLDNESIPNGVYYIRLLLDKSSQIIKLIVNR